MSAAVADCSASTIRCLSAMRAFSSSCMPLYAWIERKRAHAPTASQMKVTSTWAAMRMRVSVEQFKRAENWPH